MKQEVYFEYLDNQIKAVIDDEGVKYALSFANLWVNSPLDLLKEPMPDDAPYRDDMTALVMAINTYLWRPMIGNNQVSLFTFTWSGEYLPNKVKSLNFYPNEDMVRIYNGSNLLIIPDEDPIWEDEMKGVRLVNCRVLGPDDYDEEIPMFLWNSGVIICPSDWDNVRGEEYDDLVDLNRWIDIRSGQVAVKTGVPVLPW